VSNTDQTDSTRPESYQADLLVIGAGMAGLSAAALAARRGASVVLVEKADEVGGSAAISGGYLWTLKTYADYLSEVPLGDPALGRVLLDRYDEGVDWVRSLNVEMSDRISPRPIPLGSGYLIDILDYLMKCRGIVGQANGIVLNGATVETLDVEDGAVVGGWVRDRDGLTQVRATATVIATGGFQADDDLRRKYIGDFAGSVLVRSNPNSTGDGLRLGLSVGADVSDSMGAFYGHLIANPLTAPFVPADYLRLAQSIYSPFSVLLDRDGRRFTDESLGYYSNAQALARVSGQRAVLIADERVRVDFATQAPTEGMEIVDLPVEAERSGAHVARGADFQQLSEQIAAWGYDAEGIERGCLDFNAEIVDGSDSIDPPRLRNQRPLDEPPYFAVEVQPAITFTHGGLRIDTDARVLDVDRKPIPGLFAAGADGAGVNNVGYAGGLSVGLVFAMQLVDAIFGPPGD
jgi:succinate dehydrogenase/fumarate reductase flavoprotein subunit